MNDKFNTGGWGKRDSTQTVVEHGGGKDEQHIATAYSRALFWQRIIAVTWWMLPVPILFGRGLIVAVVAYYSVKAFRPLSNVGIFWVTICTSASVALVASGALDALWYPVFWGMQGGRLILTLGNVAIRLPLWVILIRAFLLIAPALAWDASFRLLAWRFTTEIVSPTASSVPIQQARATSVRMPRGSTVEFIDPDSKPVLTVNPVKPVPFNASNGTMVYDVLTSRSGKQVGRDALLEMLDAQPAAGLGWRYWNQEGWTRSAWEAGMELFEDLDIIDERRSGIPTVMRVTINDAISSIERLR